MRRRRSLALVRWPDAAPPPPVVVTAGFDLVKSGLTVIVTFTSTVENGTLGSHTVDWGDGSTQTIAAADTSASHAYAADGTYPIVLTARAVTGETDTASAPVTVTAPVAGVATVAFELATFWGRQVEFHDLSVDDPLNPITAVNVFWGDTWWDGAAAWDRLHLLLPDYPGEAERYHDHVYEADGTYTVRLERTYADGTIGVREHAVTVSAPAEVPTYPIGRFFTDSNGIIRDLFPGRHPAHSHVAQPRKYLDTTMPVTTGWPEYDVATATELTDALEAIEATLARVGVIYLAPGFVATNYVWPQRALAADGSQPHDAWVVVTQREADRPAGFPAAGTRILPAVGAQLPRFQSSSHSYHACDLTTGGAGIFNIRFVGVQFTVRSDFPAWKTSGGSLIKTHRDSRRVWLDRCYVAGPAFQTACTRGWHLYGFDHAAIDSWFWNFKITSSDSQAIYLTSGHRTKIVNNYLEAAGECWMVGGAAVTQGNDPDLPYQMGDLEVRRNHCRIPHAYRYRSFEFADDAELLTGNGALTVAAYDPATSDITLDALTPHDRYGATDWPVEDGGARYTIARITGGARAGSWARVTDTLSATHLRATPAGRTAAEGANWYKGAPQAGDVIELVRKYRWLPKNRSEIKNARRVEFSCNVLENGWADDDIGGQLSMMNVKVEPQDVTGNKFAATRDVNALWNVLFNGHMGFAMDHHSRDAGALYGRRVHYEHMLVLAGDPQRMAEDTTYGGAGNSHFAFQVRMDWLTMRNLTFAGFRYCWGYFSSKGQGPTGDLDYLVFDRVVSTHGQQGCMQADQYISYATARIGNLLTFRADASDSTPTAGSYPGGSELVAVVTDTDPGFVQPNRNLWQLDPGLPAADYSMLPGSQGDGRGFTAAEWAFLMDATAGVRAPVDVVPLQWSPPV